MSFPHIDYQSPFKKNNVKRSPSIRLNLSSKKVPIPKDVFEYNRQRWEAHEKELDLIQKQFKPKLTQLQKMLIVNKANDQVDQAKEPIILKPVLSQKKLKLFLSNENKQIQRDVLIENQMNKLSNLYEFGNMNYDESENYKTKRLTHFVDSILNNLKKDIAEKEAYIEKKFQGQPRSQLEVEHHAKLEELQDLRMKMQQLESTINNLQKNDSQQIQLKIDDEPPVELPKMISRRIIDYQTPRPVTPVIDYEKEYLLKQQKKRLEFEQKVSNRVQKERQKIGVFQYKNVMSMHELNKYIKEQNEIAMAPLPIELIQLKEEQALKKKLSRNSDAHKKISIMNNQSQSTRSNQTSIIKDSVSLPLLNQGDFSKITDSKEDQPIKHKLKLMTQLQKINQMNQSLTIKQPEQLSVESLLNQCSEVHKSIRSLDRKMYKKQRGQMNTLNKLNNQLEIIKVSNFLEHKMILI